METNEILASFFERDLRKLIEELNMFSNEKKLWEKSGQISNPAGNLALHIIGGTNYLIGNTLGKTGYVRQRELEFTLRDIPRIEILRQLEALILTVKEIVLHTDLQAAYPLPFDDAIRTNSYVLIQLSLHLNYHLGQVNYLRRMLA